MRRILEKTEADAFVEVCWPTAGSLGASSCSWTGPGPLLLNVTAVDSRTITFLCLLMRLGCFGHTVTENC